MQVPDTEETLNGTDNECVGQNFVNVLCRSCSDLTKIVVISFEDSG